VFLRKIDTTAIIKHLKQRKVNEGYGNVANI